MPANNNGGEDASAAYSTAGDAIMAWLLPLHVTLVVVSLLLFVWRGARMWRGRPACGRLLHRILPDSVDTLLLGSGVLLAYALHVAPWQDAWLAAKLIAIVLYILLGFIAFRHRGSVWINRTSFIIALMTVVYIVAVAHTMQPWPWA